MFKKKNILVFGKAQLSAFVGGLIGAVINFSINKYWTYQSVKPSLTSQLIKFYIVVAGSIILKSNGTVFLTHILHLDYKITRIIIDLFVSVGFNFVLQKYWVFRTSPMTDSINQMS